MDKETKIIELSEELERVKLLLQNCNGDIIRADRQLKQERNKAIEVIEGLLFICNKYANDDPYEDHIVKHTQNVLESFKQTEVK